MNKDIIQLQISMQHIQPMNDAKTLRDLTQHQPCFILGEPAPLFQQITQIPTVTKLHNHVKVVGRFRHIVQLDNISAVAQSCFLQNVNFLLELAHYCSLDFLFGHHFASEELVVLPGEAHFAELALAQSLLGQGVLVYLFDTNFVGL